MRRLKKIEQGIGDRNLPAAAVEQGRVVIYEARRMIADVNKSIRSTPRMKLKSLKATPAVGDGLKPMLQWLAPRVRRALERDALVLKELFEIASRYHGLAFAAVAVGGFLVWNHFDRQNYC